MYTYIILNEKNVMKKECQETFKLKYGSNGHRPRMLVGVR